jgi:hypothetical protein
MSCVGEPMMRRRLLLRIAAVALLVMPGVACSENTVLNDFAEYDELIREQRDAEAAADSAGPAPTESAEAAPEPSASGMPLAPGAAP